MNESFTNQSARKAIQNLGSPAWFWLLIDQTLCTMGTIPDLGLVVSYLNDMISVRFGMDPDRTDPQLSLVIVQSTKNEGKENFVASCTCECKMQSNA